MKTPDQYVAIWFDLLWNKGIESTIPEMLSDDCVVYGLGEPLKGIAAYTQTYRVFQHHFDETHMELMDSITEGDKIIGLARFTAIHKKTENKIDITFAFSAVWKDGKIVEATNVVDHYQLMIQMGVANGSELAEALA